MVLIGVDWRMVMVGFVFAGFGNFTVLGGTSPHPKIKDFCKTICGGVYIHINLPTRTYFLFTGSFVYLFIYFLILVMYRCVGNDRSDYGNGYGFYGVVWSRILYSCGCW